MASFIPCLDPDRPLPGVPPQRWAQFVADYDAFTDSPWSAKAAALGWDARSLFGCHRDMPHLAVWWGALWFVNGGAIDDISSDIIRITTAHGTQQSIRKMDHAYDFIVPVWDVPVSSAAGRYSASLP
jgi:hypothetical protein